MRATIFLVVSMLLVVSAVAEAEQSLEEGLHELAVSISATMRTGSIRKIAVVEFTDLSGYPSVLGQFVAEELITQLFNVSPGQFDVVERRQLAKVLREQKLAASGLIDPDSISRVGRLLGIQAIVTGSITDLGSQIKLNARLIAVESGKVFAAAAASVTKDAAAERLLHQSAGVESSPASGPGGDLARQRQASDVFFQNSFLRVEVKSLAITKNGTSLSLALSFKNLSPSDLFLGLKGGNCYSVGSIGSDTGLSAAMRLSGLPCINNDERSLADSNNFTAIGPGSETTIVLSLFSAFGEISGNLFAFSLPLVRLSNGNLSSFTVGIANIELLHGKR